MVKKRKRSFDKSPDQFGSIIGVLLGTSIVALFPFLLFENKMRPAAIIILIILILASGYVAFFKQKNPK